MEATKAKILIVEDEPDMILGLKDNFEFEGYKVLTATDGDAGLKSALGSRPDLIISGMNAGTNVGINVIYSGTVAAALEAAFLGVPSIAVSVQFRVDSGAGLTAIRRRDLLGLVRML